MRLTPAEGQRRHDAIRAWLAADDIAAYIVFDALNFVYVTNFLLDVEPWERPVAAIIPAASEPRLILNELSINHVAVARDRGSLWPAAITFYVEHPRVVDRTYQRPEWDRLLADQLRAAGVSRGRVAVDSLGPVSAAVRALLPEVEFVARPDLLRDLRLIKSSAEQAIIIAGGEVTGWGMGQLKSLLAPGEPILQLCFETSKRIAGYLADRYPAEAFEIHVSADTGVDTACPHSPGGNAGRRISAGDSVICNVILRTNGYVTEDERTFIMGEPTADQRHYMDAMTRAQQAAIDLMVTGTVMAEIDAAAQAVHEAAGTAPYLFHRSGHGIGLGGHEYPDDMAYNYRPLAAGMVFSAEPAVFVRGLGGFRHSDTVIVGDDAPVLATSFSKRIEDLIVSL